MIFLEKPWWPFLFLLINVGQVEMNPQCVFYQKSASVDSYGTGPSETHVTTVTPDHGLVETCKEVNSFCYTFWHVQPNTNYSSNVSEHNFDEQLIEHSGCWKAGRYEEECHENACVATTAPHKNKFWFCCCKGDYCNKNLSVHYVPPKAEAPPPVLPLVEDPDTFSDAVIIIVPVFCFLIIISAAFWVMKRYWRSEKKQEALANKQAPASSPLHDMKGLQLYELIGTGRYGKVWKGSMNEKTVAVKVFPSHNKHYYTSEKDIYTLPHMNHPNLLAYFGCDERPNFEEQPGYRLVLTYMPLGCLQDYLRENTVDWPTAVNMLLGVTQGLSHLHSEIIAGDNIKPSVCHRDLSSRNVLVGADLRCVLCDFGFALKINGAVYYQDGEHRAETTSLTDVGTLRYMAPEVLEGAVNLRDCESSLKQIDVYALAMILWEISTRCHDLYQGAQPPDYQQPFEAETGGSVSFEQMVSLVCKKKARPLFPVVWKESNPAIKLLKETIEECWDQDAEARLTGLCVKERISELPSLWERYKAPVSLMMSSITPSINPAITTNSSPVNDNSVSDETVDTTVTMLSPQDSQGKNGNIYTVACAPVGRLQPHQGRNPCLERNLVLNSSNLDVCVKGNRLYSRDINSAEVIGIPSTEDLSETHALLDQQLVPPVRSINLPGPIPYLQNPMGGNNGRPKKHNLPQPQKSWLHKKFMGFLGKRRKQSDDEEEALTQNTVDTRVYVHGQKVQTIVADCPLPPPPLTPTPTLHSENMSSSKTSSTVELTETPERMRRPNTLPLRFTMNTSSQEMIPLEEKQMEEEESSSSINKCSISSLENVQEVFTNDNVSMRPLARSDCRAPTPYEFRAGARLSLYDDRIMAGSEPCQSQRTQALPSIHSINTSKSLDVLNPHRSPVLKSRKQTSSKELVSLEIGQL